jgi:hypothetical protein
MSAYTKSTDFASKDVQLTGSPSKVIKGTEIDDELNAIQTYQQTCKIELGIIKLGK